MKVKLQDILQHYTKQEEGFVRKIYNEVEKVYYQESSNDLGFLNPNEIKIVEEITRLFNVKLKTHGGYNEAELKKTVIFNHDYPVDIDICVLEVEYNKKFNTVKHNQIMGTLYNLGIKESMIGDIIVSEEGDCQIVISGDIKDTILLSVKRYGKVPVKHKQVNDVSIKAKSLTNKIRSSKSLRLDSICKSISMISRNKMVEKIKKNKVRVNHKVIDDVTYLIKEGDLISIESYGRVLIENLEFKNGKYNVKFKTTNEN